jgi:hypothetical protein
LGGKLLVIGYWILGISDCLKLILRNFLNKNFLFAFIHSLSSLELPKKHGKDFLDYLTIAI